MNTFDNAAKSVDTFINVAQLLKQPVGATRRYQLQVEAVPLGEDRTARQLDGPIKLTRVGRGLLVTGMVTATVDLTCVRCLEEYSQPVTLDLEEEFRPSIDVASGLSIAYGNASTPGGEPAEDDFFLIGEDHVLDLTEVLRQAAWLAAPMMPICREDCPGIPLPPAASDDEATDEDRQAATEPGQVDARLAVLQHLLDESDTTTDPQPGRPMKGKERRDRHQVSHEQ